MTDPTAPNAGEAGRSVRHILLASDLTARSDRAFDRAAMLASETGAALRIVHVVDGTLVPERAIRRDVSEAEASLEEDLRESGLRERIAVSTAVVRGSAAEAILDDARTTPADLVVMGVSRDSMVTRIVGGTTIEQVIRRGDRPVLAVKARAWRPYRAVLVAIDLGEPSRAALDLALRTFPEAAVTVVHVDETSSGADREGRAHRHRIEDLVAARVAEAGRGRLGQDGSPTLVFESGRAVDALPRLIARQAPDLLVMGTHGRSALAGMLLGSVAETLLELSPRDLLVVRS